ncbi:hypothetical protein AO385_1004 [Moraxella catarrhalis]|nr:hypothetical protein AO383_1306 [Moraxella catarrhalis]OAV02277.1 hypothetical protein AO385_1004 [Moraxella catarrhalis]
MAWVLVQAQDAAELAVELPRQAAVEVVLLVPKLSQAGAVVEELVQAQG